MHACVLQLAVVVFVVVALLLLHSQRPAAAEEQFNKSEKLNVEAENCKLKTDKQGNKCVNMRANTHTQLQI